MTPALERLNAASWEQAKEAFFRCCGVQRWAERMADARPYRDSTALRDRADAELDQLSDDHWREAFLAHPRIGDKDSLRRKFASTASWAAGEQAGAASASEDVLDALAQGNRDYETRFGHIFIICATGKSAAEMLTALRARLTNPPTDELAIAAGEQRKITHLRLEKLLQS